MHEALLQVGHRQTRNRGTIGGSLCHLDPAAELVSLATGYDATVTVAGPSGSRELPFAEFPVAYMTPAIELNEMVIGVRFPRWAADHGYAFVEFARRHGDFAITSAAVLIEADAAGKITRASVTLGGMGTAPVRAREARTGDHRPGADSANFSAPPAKAAGRSRRSTTCMRRHPIASIWRPCCRAARWRRRMRACSMRRRDVQTRSRCHGGELPGAPSGAPASGLREDPDGRDAQNRADRQRQTLRRRGRGPGDAGRFHAPPARPDRHASRLRARRLRRLHHPARRPLGALLPDAGRAGERPRASHRRGHRAVRRPSCIRCSRRSATTTACNAASARPAC